MCSFVSGLIKLMRYTVHSGCTDAAFLFEDAMYIYGGEQDNENYSNKVRKFDLVLHNWVEVAVRSTFASPGGLELFGSGFLEKRNEFVVCCGEGPSGAQNKTWVFEVKDAKWRVPVVKGYPPSKRDLVASCTGEDCLFIYGGMRKSVQLSDLYVLNCTTSRFHWSRMLVAPGLPRVSATLSYVNGRLLLYGGKREGAFTSDLFIVDLSDTNKTLKEVTPERGTLLNESLETAGHAAVVSQSGLYILGGSMRHIGNVFVLQGRS